MRRFFNRLATGGGGGQTDKASSRPLGPHRGNGAVVHNNNEAVKEKSGLPARPHVNAAADKDRDDNGPGAKVRALAARYETLSTSGGVKERRAIARASQNGHTSPPSAEAPTATDYSKVLEGPTSPALERPSPTGQSMKIETKEVEVKPTQSSPPLERSPNVLADAPAHSPERPGSDVNGQMQSAAAARGLPPLRVSQGQPKSVAFAPSPKKPIRTSSPMPPMPTEALANIESVEADERANLTGNGQSSGSGFYQISTGSSHSISNFAKPTMASTARAKAIGPAGPRQSGGSPRGTSSASIPTVAAAQRQATERFPSGATSRSSNSQSPLAPKMLRSYSATQAASRRTVNASSSDHLPFQLRPTNNVSTASAGSSISLVSPVGTGESPSVSFPSSIPFSGKTPALGMLRSASPQSVGSGSSPSVRGSMGGAGGVGVGMHDYFTNSRRASYQGRYHSGGSSGAGIASSIRSIGLPSWSEMTQEDLVSNLGARERTRQEVLWEIVASEERYVQELEKTKEFYLDALLHPYRLSPPISPDPSHSATLAALEGRRQRPGAASKEFTKESGTLLSSDAAPPVGGSEGLPIASQYMSLSQVQRDRLGQAQATPSATEEGALDSVSRSRGRGTPTARPLAAANGRRSALSSANASATSLAQPKPSQRAMDRQDKTANWSSRRSKGTSHDGSSYSSSRAGYDLTDGQGAPLVLPGPLRVVLEALDNGILEGHALLSESLRVRYEEQWPLVRSLADVFTRFSYVLDHYRQYVVHLERALDCLEDAALMERAMRGKRLRKDRLTTSVALGRAIARLESTAAERGECGLAIFLAMPFQRLLKYPLLFQNLLFHTDASTFEFETTVKMVVDVERIVRTIEDAKGNKEERDKTIDAFARIEGIKDRTLLRPRADRILVEERPLYQAGPRRALSESNNGPPAVLDRQSALATGEPVMGTAALSTPDTHLASASAHHSTIRGKRSYRRLSDLLTFAQANSGEEHDQITYTKAPNVGSKKDLWLVRFSDVEIRCQRVGVTALPMVSTGALQPVGAATAQSRPDSTSESEQRTAQEVDELVEEQERMRDEFRRTKESKERLRALRSTTLRSKTRNLYRFVAVTGWKSTQQRPVPTELDGIEGLATAVEEDEEDEDAGEQDEDDEEMDDKDGEADDDDNASNASLETDGGMLDAETYVRQSKLSFSYGGEDRVEPRLRSGHALRSRSSGGAGRDGAMLPLSPLAPSGTKRHSFGSTMRPTPTSKVVAASSKSRPDKFGHRLRHMDESHRRRDSFPNVDGHRSASSVLDDEDGEEDGGSLIHHTSAQTQGLSSAAALERTPSFSFTDHDAPILQPEPTPRTIRPSFLRDRSMDSNLLLMGSLIQPSIPDDDAPLY